MSTRQKIAGAQSDVEQSLIVLLRFRGLHWDDQIHVKDTAGRHAAVLLWKSII